MRDFTATTDLLKPFLIDYLEEQGINTSSHFTCLFPDHEDSTPSCHIVGRNGDSPRFFCQGCSRWGDIFDAVHLLEGKPRLGVEWLQDTLVYLANKFNVELQTQELTEEQIYKLDVYRAYRAAAQLLRTIGLDDNTLLQDELKKRNWKAEALSALSIGTVPSYTEFRRALRNQGFTTTFLDEIGLNKNDLFSEDCLIYTWRDEKGRPVGFAARDLAYEQKVQEAEQEGKKHKGGKYTNTRTTGTRINLFQKGKRLYGIDTALKEDGPLYIFEGQADYVSAYTHGLRKCASIGGSKLREEHILLLKKLGIYDIVICLDGDNTGREKLEEALDLLAGNRDMRVRVIELPFDCDPDTYIRENGIREFRKLAHWSAFEWRMNQFKDDDDEVQICHQMIPYIVNESSPVTREKLCKILARRTGITYKNITAELNNMLDKKANQRSKERQSLLDQAVFEIKNNPEQAEVIFQKAQNGLLELVRKHDKDVLSHEDFVCSIDTQKANEEKLEATDVGFKLGPDLKIIEDTFMGEWLGNFIGLGAKPNVGKTGLLCKIGYSIATYNDDVVVIYHSIDDMAEQILPRFVTIGETSRRLSMNMVKQPNYWTKNVGLSWVTEKRELGYKKLRDLATDGRLILKDLNHGGSLPFAENLICYFQEKYPERRIVYILDNFHKLQDFPGKDERVRFKALSTEIKNIAVRRNCCILSSVEYTKLPAGVRPTNNNIAESGQIEYDANALIHLYSDVSENPDSFTVCHQDTDWRGETIYLPRIECIVGKNKISEVKRSFFLDFWPAASDYRMVTQKQVVEDSKVMKESGHSPGDDCFKELF